MLKTLSIITLALLSNTVRSLKVGGPKEAFDWYNLPDIKAADF